MPPKYASKEEVFKDLYPDLPSNNQYLTFSFTNELETKQWHAWKHCEEVYKNQKKEFYDADPMAEYQDWKTAHPTPKLNAEQVIKNMKDEYKRDIQSEYFSALWSLKGAGVLPGGHDLDEKWNKEGMADHINQSIGRVVTVIETMKQKINDEPEVFRKRDLVLTLCHIEKQMNTLITVRDTVLVIDSFAK